jgi:hypothetical protein
VNITLNFGILNGNIGNTFTFNFLSDNSADSSRHEYQAIGQLQVFRLLDYEANPNYTLVLFVFDTQHFATITVIINLVPENTKAPYFNLNPGFTNYQYIVYEGTAISELNGFDVSLSYIRMKMKNFICIDQSSRSR